MTVRRTFWNAVAAAAMATKSSSGWRGMSNMPAVRELTLECSDGTILAAQQWIPNHPPQQQSMPARSVLCLHGWMDNCRSFYKLAPALTATGNYNVVALDMLGHGRSSHKSIDAPPMVQAELVYYVSEALDILKQKGHFQSTSTTTSSKKSEDTVHDERVTLIGHSLGAGVSSLLTASFPELIDQLVLLDGAGFLAREAKDTAMHARKHIRRRKLFHQQQQQQQKRPKKQRYYPTLDMAIQRRIESAEASPGTQTLSYEAARQIVLRSTHQDHLLDASSQDAEDPTVDTASVDKVRFQHDPRFAWPSLQYMTWEQVQGILQSLADSDVDCCILLAENGWPFQPEHIAQALDIVQPRSHAVLPGSHFFHADPESADAVIEHVLDFLSSRDER